MPRRFPSHLLLALMLLAPAAGPLRAQENILRFYHRADSISEHPSRISDYEIRKSKRVGQNTVTFIGRKGSRRILIAAVTPKPLKNLRRELALTLQFEKGKPGL